MKIYLEDDKDKTAGFNGGKITLVILLKKKHHSPVQTYFNSLGFLKIDFS